MKRESSVPSDTKEIEDLLQKLELHQEETSKIIRTLRAKISKESTRSNTPREIKITLKESRKLIGRQVKVINPRKNEPLIGFIQLVGSVYITIGLPGHKDRHRVPKNLRLIQRAEPRRQPKK